MPRTKKETAKETVKETVKQVADTATAKKPTVKKEGGKTEHGLPEHHGRFRYAGADCAETAEGSGRRLCEDRREQGFLGRQKRRNRQR